MITSKAGSTALLLLGMLVCFGCGGGQAGNGTIPAAEGGQCSLAKDIIPESEKGNYDCESQSGCEWKKLGGKVELAFACCPLKLSCENKDDPAYRRCCRIID